MKKILFLIIFFSTNSFATTCPPCGPLLDFIHNEPYYSTLTDTVTTYGCDESSAAGADCVEHSGSGCSGHTAYIGGYSYVRYYNMYSLSYQTALCGSCAEGCSCPNACASLCSELDQSCGIDGYVITDSQQCEGHCKCTDARSQADQECGQGNYTMDDSSSDCTYTCNGNPGTCPAGCESACSTAESFCSPNGYTIKDAPDCGATCNLPSGTCPSGCETACQQLETGCAPLGYTIDDSVACTGHCNTLPACPAGCQDICDSMGSRCGIAGYVFTDEQNCVAECKNPNCGQLAVDRCGDIENVTWDNVAACRFHCTDCETEFQKARQDCPFGFDGGIVPPDSMGVSTKCYYKCKDCNQLARDCAGSCYGDKTYASNDCTQVDGVVTRNTCRCRSSGSTDPTDPSEPDPGHNPSQTCDEARSRCQAACSFVCNESNPAASSCDCSHNPDPETPDNPDPSDPSDTNGWLSGIKEEIEKSNGWLEAIKHNTDDANDLQKDANDDLDNIAENMRRSVDNQGKLQKTSEEGNKLLADIKNAVDGIDTASGFNANISAPVEGVDDLGSSGDVTGEGYTADANPADLPLPESTLQDFGILAHSEESTYIDEAKSRISGMGVSLSGSTCQETVSFTGVGTWNLDFCPYADYFSKIGGLLVMLVALRELLNFA